MIRLTGVSFILPARVVDASLLARRAKNHTVSRNGVMSIAFVCPNGHQLNAPKELAGKPGQCPKCGTKFLVPSLTESADATAPVTGSGISSKSSPAAKGADAAVGTGSGKSGRGAAQDRFYFLCPNG